MWVALTLSWHVDAAYELIHHIRCTPLDNCKARYIILASLDYSDRKGPLHLTELGFERMRILVAVKRVIDYAVHVRVKADKVGDLPAPACCLLHTRLHGGESAQWPGPRMLPDRLPALPHIACAERRRGRPSKDEHEPVL